MSSSGSCGGRLQNSVFGSTVSWYQDRCVGCWAMAVRRSASASSRLCCGQAVHQVQIEVVKAGGTRHVGGADGLVAIVDAPQRLELVGLEALHADRQAIDAELAIVAKLGLLEGTRIGFQSDLDVIGEADPSLQPGEDALQRRRAEQAWRAAAEEDRCQPAPLHLFDILIQVGQQCVDIGGFRQLGAGGVGIEVAVRAFAHAPGDVHVRRQWRQRVERRRLVLPGYRSGCRVGGNDHAMPRRCLSSDMARARWLSWFFSAAGSSALEQSHSGTQNSGS